MSDKYFYPIPEKNLVARFKPLFEKLTNGYSATLLALPHTGRTSHLRFIFSQTEMLNRFGINEKFRICFIDGMNSINSYESFVFEAIQILSENNVSEGLNSLSDSYLLSSKLINITSEISKDSKIIFVVSIKKNNIEFFSEIDNLMVRLQKSSINHQISILWSLDLNVFLNLKASHLSSTLGENIVYFKPFDRDETIHSIIRFAKLKGVKLTTKDLNEAQKNIGGIAAFFHTYVQNRTSKVQNSVFNSINEDVIADLKSHRLHLNEHFKKLCTKDALDFIQHLPSPKTIYESLQFSKAPTAQEILITNLLIKNVDKPVTRDDVAKALWGPSWEKRYSDWAIDKSISRLRNNMSSPDYKLITIQNLGYQLTKVI